MERSEEALRERVRETPLSERLKTCEKYVASMCAERRPPKMTIPLQHYDEDFYIYTTLADAQATIAALQAQLESANKLIRKKNCDLGRAETIVNDLQSQLTQRTAERDCARRRVDELEAREVDVVLLREDLEQRTAELEAAKRERDKIVEARQNMLQSMANWLAQLKPTHHPLYRKGVEEVIAAAFNGYRTDKGQPVLLSEWQEQQIRLANLQAELERVRGAH